MALDQSEIAPPASLEAEQSILGGLMLDNDAIDRVVDLRAEHFYNAEHRAIYSCLVDFLTSGKPADVITVFEAMRHQPNRDDLLPYLNALAQNTPSAANIVRYAEIVRDRWLKRSIIAAGHEIADMGFAGPADAHDILDAARIRIEQLAESRTDTDPVRAGDDMACHLAVVEQRIEGTVRAIPTGYRDLDLRLNGGVRRGQLIVVAARPKMGKSAFALCVARNAAVAHTVLYLSLEMSRSELHDRNIAAVGRIDLSALLREHGLIDDDWSRVVEATEQVSRLALYLDDQGGLRVRDVQRKARKIRRRHGLDLLIVDYLQLMEGQGDNRNAQIEGITRGLKALAKELDVGILLLSQLNRELEKRDNKRPIPSDLRDSGSIEQDADAVLFLYRDEVYNENSTQPGICEVNVSLNRQGQPGRDALAFIDHELRFESCGGLWRPPVSVAPRRARGYSPEQQ